MGMDMVLYALCKKAAAGAVSGVSSMSVDGLTLNIECTDGTHLEMVFPEPEDGKSIVDVDINEEKHLICTLSDGTEVDAGELPGGTGGGELTKEINTVISVGGISSGTKYEVGTPIENILSDMLEPILYPTFTAPSCAVTYNANTYYAVGATIGNQPATITYSAGAIMLNGVKQADRAGAASGYSLATVGADTEYSNSGDSNTFNVPALTKSTKGTIKINATVNYAKGAQPKDSKGNDYQSPLPAGSVTASKTINFIQPYYYGKSASATVSNFTGLTEKVEPKANKTYTFTTNNEHMVFAYDASYGNLSSILDSNGFETISGWTKSSLTVGGFNYFVYVANSATTDTNAAFTFKY